MNQPATPPVPTRSVLLTDKTGGQIEVLVDDAACDGTEPAAAEGATQATAAAAIVLLPSSQRDARDLGPLAAHLGGAGFRVLRPQPRGMGRSSAAPTDLSLHHLASDVAQAISTLGGGRAIVAGHAFGHFVARVTDLDHAALVRGVVVMAGAALSFPPGLTQALDLAADAAQPRSARLAALQQAFFAPGNDPTPWLAGWHPQLREVYRQASATPPKAAWWPHSHSPVLDLQAEGDPWRPSATRDELRAVLGDQVSVALIAHASHALPHEQPAAVAAAITAWARTLPA
jgi:pimeloyl-ACP methyl ester carboxylesterase